MPDLAGGSHFAPDMRSAVATIVAVAFLANASLANAQEYATAAPLPGYCPWRSEGAAFDLADTLTDARCASDRSQRVRSELVAIVAERAAYVGPREMGKPSGVERQVTFKWFPTVMADPDDPGAVVFAMNQYKPYRDLKDANAAWTSTVSAVGEALAPIAADRFILIGPKWMTSGAAAGVKTAVDITGQAAFAVPFAMAVPMTMGTSMLPLSAMYAEALFMAPTGSAHGASEFVDGIREGNYERALEGAAEFCGNVGIVMLTAGGAASAAGKALPPARAPITLFDEGVPALELKAPIPPDPRAIISDGKMGYLFGKATGRTHNIERTAQNVRKLASIGIHDDATGHAIIQRHFDDIVTDSSNISSMYSNEWGTYQVRESLLSGPNGFLKLESTWEVLPSGDLRMTTVIPVAGGN